jgi:meso-butanediol dehydrogenase/(S,S)-butanediol dehydrogenase/diacetyl reductase
MDSRVAVVTGGGSGIGLAVARALLADGPVVVVDRDAEAIKAVSSEGLDALCLDVTVTDDWRQLVDHLRARYGRLDTLVHNAGTAHIAPLPQNSDDDLRRVLDTNVLSVLIGTREAWDLLVASRGCIVNVASVSAIVGQDAAAAYVASKGAVVAVTRALATELAAHGVRVNSVCPGSTMTPLLERHFASLPDGDEAHRRLVARHPLGRLLTPADIAPTIVHLTRPEAGAITGSNVVVDGGLTATFDYGTTFAGGGSHHADA